MAWVIRLFQSGTTLVEDDADVGHRPHFYVHSSNLDLNEEDNQAFRYEAAKALAHWLNQSPDCWWQPWWASSLERISLGVCRSRGPGVELTAVGPLRDPSGECRWVPIPKDDGAREALIDHVMSKVRAKV